MIEVYYKVLRETGDIQKAVTAFLTAAVEAKRYEEASGR